MAAQWAIADTYGNRAQGVLTATLVDGGQSSANIHLLALIVPVPLPRGVPCAATPRSKLAERNQAVKRDRKGERERERERERGEREKERKKDRKTERKTERERERRREEGEEGESRTPTAVALSRCCRTVEHQQQWLCHAGAAVIAKIRVHSVVCSLYFV